jgi:GH15 family glucan-1,4-alpha-glucosidase
MNAPEARALGVPAGENAFPAIGDYAAIGDCRTLALVGKNGSVEWLCLPAFASASVFGALLDREAGHFTVRPAVPHTVTRAYVSGSNVLQTTFTCASGVLRLTDCITLPQGVRARELEPQHELLRTVECTEGEVPIEVIFAPRPEYGRVVPRYALRGRLGWQCTGCAMAAFLQSDVPLRPGTQGALVGYDRLSAGQVRYLSFTYDESEVCVLPPLGNWARARLDYTIDWWRRWSARCGYAGPYREQVVRSLLALKLLTCSLSGAVLAAPTTSLPELIGGTRNWDYRFCWLRDSALILDSFLSVGYVDEAEAFLGWLLHATRLTWPSLQVMYDMYGETRLKEKLLAHLSGYRGSRPVRIGNAAHEQLQLDIYGELVSTVHLYVQKGGELDASERRMLAGLGMTVCRLWRRPDHGIWETRNAPRHHTYSKAMCWVALDCLRDSNGRMSLGLDDAVLARESQALREAIESDGFNEKLNGYVGYFGGEDADASLLLLSRQRYRRPRHPRMAGTYALIERQLTRNGLLLRYPLDRDYDGIEEPENAFAPCSFWAVEYLASAGRLDEAHALFRRLLGCANDVGLYAEEIGTRDDSPVGNFPQGFTHVSMVSAALALERAARLA